MRNLAYLFASVAIAALYAGSANAQASQTFVSGTGDDANACSRTAPCKTFTGAITKTNAGGDIYCLDPGGYGPVTINKAISIICDGTFAGIAVNTGNAITVNAGAVDSVTLSGIEIDGLGLGHTGIAFNTGGALHLRNVKVRNFSRFGLSFAPFATSKLYVTDGVFTENGSGVLPTDAGIIVQPATGGSANAHLSRVRLENNFNGLVTIGVSGAGAINISMDDSLVSGSASNGVFGRVPPGGAPFGLMISGSMISGNFGAGLRADQSSASIIRVGNSMISANAVGISTANAAQIRSFGDNQVNANGSGETFTGSDLLK